MDGDFSTPAAPLAGGRHHQVLPCAMRTCRGVELSKPRPSRGHGFERVRLGLNAVLAGWNDQLGGRSMLRFTDMKANVPETFTFKAPAGADVLEDAPAAPKR
jgi:hypothetical protein